MMMRTLYLASALTIGGGVVVLAQSEDFVSPMLAFYEAGVICAQDGGIERDAPDTVAGTIFSIRDAPEFVSTGRVVPAVLGIGFGVRAGLDLPLGVDGVKMHVTHPPFAGSGATEQSFVSNMGTAVDPGITFYQFDHAYELAVGEWTMTASLSGVKLYEVTFMVVPPAALPDLAGVCGYLDLLG